MVSIDYDKLNEVIGALKKLYEMVQCNLEGSKLGYSGICITPLEALMCPQIGDFEGDMDELQTQGNKALEDIQELITGIHNVINKFQESESKIACDIKVATVSDSLLGGVENKNGSNKLDIDSVATSAFAAGGIGALDKSIGVASVEGLLEGRNNIYNTGYKRKTRRAFGYAKTVKYEKPLEGNYLLSYMSLI